MYFESASKKKSARGQLAKEKIAYFPTKKEEKKEARP